MTITDMVPGSRNRRRLNVYLDGEYSFACFAEIASQFGLRRGGELSEEEVRRLQAEDEAIRAREYALNLASRGPRSERQYRDKLRSRGYSEAGQEAALEILRNYNYIDDAAYAEQYAAELAQKYGRWTIRKKLAERGIAPEIIERVTEDCDDADALATQLRRLRARPRYEEPRRERDRIVRSLASKGFGFDEIREALSASDKEGEPDD